MVYFIWAAAIFLIALTIYLKHVSDKNTYYVGFGGTHYNKPIPAAMAKDQLEIYEQICRGQEKKGMSESEASAYAIKMTASIDPSAYGLKEKPFRHG